MPIPSGTLRILSLHRNKRQKPHLRKEEFHSLLRPLPVPAFTLPNDFRIEKIKPQCGKHSNPPYNMHLDQTEGSLLDIVAWLDSRQDRHWLDSGLLLSAVVVGSCVGHRLLLASGYGSGSRHCCRGRPVRCCYCTCNYALQFSVFLLHFLRNLYRLYH